MGVCLSASANDKSIFNPTVRAQEKQILSSFDVFARTGTNDKQKNQTDFRSTGFGVGDAYIEYGFTDQTSWTFEVLSGANDLRSFAGIGQPSYRDGNARVGVDFQAIDVKFVGLNVFGKYGFGLTEVNTGVDAKEPTRRNDFTVGAKLFGEVGPFSWGLTNSIYYAMRDFSKENIDTKGYFDAELAHDSRFDYLASLDLMVQATSKWAAKVQFDFRLYGEQKYKDVANNDAYKLRSFSDASATLGAVYTISSGASIMPYLSYHLANKITEVDDAGARTSDRLYNNYFQTGVKFGFAF
jgi:hypothetical protein